MNKVIFKMESFIVKGYIFEFLVSKIELILKNYRKEYVYL